MPLQGFEYIVYSIRRAIPYAIDFTLSERDVNSFVMENIPRWRGRGKNKMFEKQ